MNLETFFKNFDWLADAPNGVQKLRELILYLAMRGKLEAQNSNDEPAITLLKHIQKDKKSENKKTQKRNSETEVSSLTCEGIFDIPTTWCWSYLDFICEQIGDIDHKMPQSVDIGVPFLSAKDLKDDGTLDFSNPKFISEEDFERLSRKIKPTLGDIIYSRIGAKLGKARLVEVDKQFLISYSCCLIRSRHQYINNKYLQLFLDSHLALNQAHIGTQSIGVPDLGLGVIKKYKVPIPPLDEQKRIVAKIDELMTLCDRLSERQQKRRSTRIIINNAAIGQLLTAREPEVFNKSWQHICNNFDLLYSTPDNIGKLRQAILQLAVQGKLVPQDANDEPASVLLEKIKLEKELLVKNGKIKKEKSLPAINIEKMLYEIPQGWKWIQLGEIAKTIEYGTSEKSSDIVDEVPVFRMNNIHEGKVLFNNFKYVSTSIKDLPRLYLQDKDILFNRTNSYDLVGKTGVFHGVSDRYTFASYLIRIKLFLNYISPELINIIMSSAYFRQTQIEPEITQQCGQANFNGTKLKNAVIPLPPLAEQHRIVAKVNQLMSLCDILETKLTQSVTDSEKLMEAAVRQILAANSNKTDKHESVLLESIDEEAAKPETQTAGRGNKKNRGQDTEAVQLNLPLV